MVICSEASGTYQRLVHTAFSKLLGLLEAYSSVSSLMPETCWADNSFSPGKLMAFVIAVGSVKFCTYCLCACMYTHMYHSAHMKAKGHVGRVGSLPLLCGSQGSK